MLQGKGKMNKTHLIVACIIVISLSIISPVFAEPIKVLFSPNGGCQQAVIQEIIQAQKTIDIAMYNLTTREISQELVKAKERDGYSWIGAKLTASIPKAGI